MNQRKVFKDDAFGQRDRKDVKPTIDEFIKDYEACGSFARRKDATVLNPSALYTIGEILLIAKGEIDALKKSVKISEIQ